MTITYKDTKEFNAQELQDLFLSVHWSSGYHPEKTGDCHAKLQYRLQCLGR